MNERVAPPSPQGGLSLKAPGQGPLPAEHPPVRWGRVGVLLMNLGTPEGTSYWPMRRYLKEFLSDRRVIEVPRLIWWPLLNLVILTKRPGRRAATTRARLEQRARRGSAEDHHPGPGRAAPGGDGRFGGGRLGHALRQAEVHLRLQALLDQGCDRILLVPLYPQYAAATSATACDQAFKALMQMRWQPTIRVSAPTTTTPSTSRRWRPRSARGWPSSISSRR